MSLLKTMENKKYDKIYTYFGDCFIGPRKDAPIPSGSLIVCLKCESFFAFTIGEIPPEIFTDSTETYWEIRDLFGSIWGRNIFSPKRYWKDWLWCPNCLTDPHVSGELVYLPVGPMCLMMALNWRRNG